MATSMIKPLWRPGITAALVVVIASLIGGCGTPEFTYVKNSDEHVYFKVPHEWSEVRAVDPVDLTRHLDEVSLEAEKRRASRVWSVSYAADEGLESHVLFQNANHPLVYAKVYQLTEEERDTMSLDTMRDVLGLPVSKPVRDSIAEREGQIDDAVENGQISTEEASALRTDLTDFELIADRVLTPGDGVRGVRTLFNYRYEGGPLHTFDQTVYLSADASRIYLIVISCATRCFRERFDELNEVATSFTVRSE